MKPIKQGGVLGRNLKHARKIKLARLALFMIALFVGIGTYASHSGNVTGGVIAAATSLAIVTPGAIDPESPEIKMMNKIKGEIKSAVESESKNSVAELVKKLEAMEAKAKESKEADIIKEVAELQGIVKSIQEEAKIKNKGESVASQLKSNFTKLRSIASKMSTEEVVIKALTDRSDIANNQQAVDLPNIGQLATRKLSLYDLFPKINIGESNNNGTVRYYDWDEDTIARAAAAVAEGVAFPESTAKFKKGSITLQKIGDTLPVTEEFFEDEAMFASELEMFLAINVALEIDRQLADGDGTSNTITGLKASVSAYSLPSVGTVENATIYDLIVKLSENITATKGSKYMPNFAVMNIVDINKMKLAKDANENYIIPPFVSRDGAIVAGITIIESNIITADTMVIGDSRFARIYEKGGIVLSKGMSGTQFVEDEMTLKARKRLAFLIRTADAGGFLKVTSISSAVAAIDTSNT